MHIQLHHSSLLETLAVQCMLQGIWELMNYTIDVIIMQKIIWVSLSKPKHCQLSCMYSTLHTQNVLKKLESHTLGSKSGMCVCCILKNFLMNPWTDIWKDGRDQHYSPC